MDKTTIKQGIWEVKVDHDFEHHMVCLIEECAELQQAICKRYRGRVNDNDNVTEEIADVLINIEIIKLVFDIRDFDVEKIMVEKLDRYRRRKARGDNN